HSEQAHNEHSAHNFSPFLTRIHCDPRIASRSVVSRVSRKSARVPIEFGEVALSRLRAMLAEAGWEVLWKVQGFSNFLASTKRSRRRLRNGSSSGHSTWISTGTCSR